MSSFDAQVYAKELLADARAVLANFKGDMSETKAELEALQQDIQATLAVLAVEKDSRRARALQEDLVTFLPGRKLAIVSAAKSAGASHLEAGLELALTVATKAAVALAKSFLPFPIPGI